MFFKIISALFFVFFYYSLPAQILEFEWVAEYPNVNLQGGIANEIVIDNDRNIYLCSGDVDMSTSFLLLKYDSIGGLKWNAKYDEPYPDFLRTCVLSETGLIAGLNLSGPPGTGIGRGVHLSYDEDGNQRYIKSVHDSQQYSSDLYDLKLDENGNLYAFGSVCDSACDITNFTNWYSIAKIDAFTGDVVWEKHERLGRASKAQIIGDRIRVFGDVVTPDSTIVRSLFDFDLDGNVIDSLLLFEWSGASYTILDNKGEMVVADDQICSYDISGDTSWCYDYFEANPDFIGGVREMIADENNNIYITGWLKDNANNLSYTKTAKISFEGNVLWENKSHYVDTVSYEDGLTISISDKYVFVGSKAFFGDDANLISDFRPILYSKENGDVLYDTLIHFSTNESPRYSAWDGEHFYLSGTYFTGDNPDKPSTIVLFKIGIDEPVPAQEQNIIQKISTYPNPFQNTFDLSIKTTQSGTAQMAVFNTIGQKVLEQETTLVSGANKVSIETINGWAAGVYFIWVEMNGQVYFEKVVKGE